MNTINVFPTNLNEKNLVIEFLTANNIKFDSIPEKNTEMSIDSDFLESMEQSFKEVMSDKIPMREFNLNN